MPRQSYHKRRAPSPEQQAKAQERREKFRGLVRQVAAMSEEERQAIVSRVGAVVTCEGHPLSLTNTMLCIMQSPGVSMVGGFQQWQRQGRQVSKGEHGIAIWIPVAGGKIEDAGAGEDSEAEGRTRFIMGYVFDISQTHAAEEVAA